MITGPLTSVKFLEEAPLFPPQERTSAQKAGLRYEAKVADLITHLYTNVQVGPWIAYTDARGNHICQPDLLIWLTERHLLVGETKLSHIPAARQKLRSLYMPLAQALHPDASVSACQIFRNYRKTAHKRLLSIYDLKDITKGTYRECQYLCP